VANRLGRSLTASAVLGVCLSCSLFPFESGVIPNHRNPIPSCDGRSLRPAVEQLLKPVLFAWVAAEDSERNRDAYYTAFEQLLAMHTADAHEAQAALMAYYTGEHSGDEMLEATLAEPRVFDPLVTAFRTCRPTLTFESDLTGVVVLRTLYDIYAEERARGGPTASNKGMKQTKPGQLRSFAAYPRCWTDVAGEA